jgi:hypothetical protein
MPSTYFTRSRNAETGGETTWRLLWTPEQVENEREYERSRRDGWIFEIIENKDGDTRSPYNGWPNWDTWCVELWASNDEHTYNLRLVIFEDAYNNSVVPTAWETSDDVARDVQHYYEYVVEEVATDKINLWRKDFDYMRQHLGEYYREWYEARQHIFTGDWD